MPFADAAPLTKNGWGRLKINFFSLGEWDK
jgi:hypothetical protein